MTAVLVGGRDHGRERMVVFVAATLLVIFRAFVFVWWEQSHFDADQAVVGLMAKHLLEGRAFPLFFYGQQYLLGVESWLVAPFFLVGGVSVFTLKLPLLLLNVAAVILLIAGLERFTGLRPWFAGLVALFLILPPPSAASRLVQANGCNIEPFVYVLLLWFVRDRPLWLGIIAGLGVLNREFTIYGVAALGAIDLWQGRLWQAERLRAWGLAALVALGMWQAVQALIPFASPRGPGTRYAEINVLNHATEVQQRICLPDDMPQRLSALVTAQLPELFGARQQPVVRVGIIGSTVQGIDGLWPILVVALMVAAGRAWWIARADRETRMADRFAFGAYLALIGAQSAIVYGATCGQRSHLTMRYMLLALLAPVGIAACYLAVEHSTRWARALMGVVALWAVVSAAAHLALLVEYATAQPLAEHRLLTSYLERQRVTHGIAGFWEAYTVTFLSNERVRVASSDLVRVEEYVREFEQHRQTAMSISGARCDGPQVARWWVCRP